VPGPLAPLMPQGPPTSVLACFVCFSLVRPTRFEIRWIYCPNLVPYLYYSRKRRLGIHIRVLMLHARILVAIHVGRCRLPDVEALPAGSAPLRNEREGLEQKIERAVRLRSADVGRPALWTARLVALLREILVVFEIRHPLSVYSQTLSATAAHLRLDLLETRGHLEFCRIYRNCREVAGFGHHLE
jgi:hypothetical protein